MKTYDNFDISDKIDRYIHSARDRAILRDHFVDGVSIIDLSQKYILSNRTVWGILKRGADVISEYMELYLHEN